MVQVEGLPKEYRLAISRDRRGIEIHSFQTRRTLILPVEDVPLLIDYLSNLPTTSSASETVCLDPSS